MSAPALDNGAHESDHPDAFHDLLFTVAGTLDVREVFQRLSAIVARIIPHDHAELALLTDSTQLSVYACTDGAPLDRDELKAATDPSVARIFHVAASSRGHQCGVRVPIWADGQPIGSLTLLSRQCDTYSQGHLILARHVADCLAVALSHQRLAEAARQSAESLARAEPERRVRTPIERPDLKVGSRRVVGRSREWQEVLRRVAQVASAETTVLLTGESGTGKEVVARLIHRASNRKDGPFVPVNCAGLVEQLLESELFGHERGAFTGAHQAKPGQIELASGGVFFLDEVSEMSLSAQAKFLRVLQEREFQRLGATRVQKANVRVIAATNGDLGKALERGAFREDLYYRIHVFDVRIPPLRDRKDDILILSEAFLEEIATSLGRPPARLTGCAKSALLGHDWPGNVRELHNVLERAAILSEGAAITAEHLSLGAGRAVAATLTDLMVVERQTIERVMRDTGWNKSRAARRLGLSRTQLYGRLRKYVLEEPSYASAQ
jgi:transcriptional regulator with GAF, ATPase, and Fis domain